MTRRKKTQSDQNPSQDKKPSRKATAAPAPSLSDDQLQALFFQHKGNYERLLAAKKKSDADFKNGCKLAKSELGKLAVDKIKIAIKLETQEGEAEVKAQISGAIQVARWVGADVGTQFEMFDDPDRTPAADRAFADGKRAGLKGEPAKPPHSPETEQYRRWMDGHADGNAALARGGFKPLEDDGNDGGMPREEFKQQLREMTAGTIGTEESTHTIVQ